MGRSRAQPVALGRWMPLPDSVAGRSTSRGIIMATQDSRKGRSTSRKPNKPKRKKNKKKSDTKPWRREPLKTSRTLCGFFPHHCEEHFEKIAYIADGLLKGPHKDKPVTFARDVKAHYEKWRTQIEDGVIELAMETAFWMGMSFGMLMLQGGMPAMRRGKKQLTDLARARGRRKMKIVEPEIIRREANKIWKANPDKNITWVRKKTAEVLTKKLEGDQSISAVTVLRHTKDMAKPSRAKK